MEKLVYILFGFLLVSFSPKKTAELPGCLCADIVILSDFSGSISGSEKIVTNTVKKLVSEIPPELNIIRFALISFADQGAAKVEVSLTADYEKLLEGVRTYEKKKAYSEATHLISGLELAREVFIMNDQRQGCFRIMIIISDGKLTDRFKAVPLAREMRNNSDRPVAIFTLSSFSDEDAVPRIQIGPTIGPDTVLKAVLMQSIKHEVLDSLSGGAYFKRDVDALREEIRKWDMCL